MGGHGEPTGLTMDPAIEKWADMHKNRPKYFRWNARTAKVAFAYVIVFPAIVGALGYYTEGKYDLRGKRRGDVMKEH